MNTSIAAEVKRFLHSVSANTLPKHLSSIVSISSPSTVSIDTRNMGLENDYIYIYTCTYVYRQDLRCNSLLVIGHFKYTFIWLIELIGHHISKSSRTKSITVEYTIDKQTDEYVILKITINGFCSAHHSNCEYMFCILCSVVIPCKHLNLFIVI